MEAIAKFEEALDLVAPGNWLFEDLKIRLVSVYQDLGDLEGLTNYLTAKIAEAPTDTEFRDLLAETYTRMVKLDPVLLKNAPLQSLQVITLILTCSSCHHSMAG